MKVKKNNVNSYIVLDFETGGLSNFSQDPSRRRLPHPQVVPITEVALIVLDGVNLTELVRYDNLIQPYDESLEYQSGARELNGITKEMCIKDGIPLEEAVKDMCTAFEEDGIRAVNGSKFYKPVIVAHNAGFENMFIKDIFSRCKVDLSKHIYGDVLHNGEFTTVPTDTVILCKMAWGHNTLINYKLPTCLEHAGIDQADGHRAMSDVAATIQLFRQLVGRMRSGKESTLGIEARDNVREKFEF